MVQSSSPESGRAGRRLVVQSSRSPDRAISEEANAWPSNWLRRATKIDGFAIKQQVLPGAKPGGVNELAMDDTAGAGKIWIEEMSLNYASMRRA